MKPQIYPPTRSIRWYTVICAVITVLITLPALLSFSVRWQEIEASLRDGIFFLVIPVVWVSSVWIAQMRNTNVVIGALQTRNERLYCWHIIGNIMFGASVGYALGLLIVVIAGITLTTINAIPWLAFLATWIVLCCVCIWSVLLALSLYQKVSTRVLPMVVLVFIVLLLALPMLINRTVLANSGMSLLSLAPIWGNGFPTVGWKSTVTVLLLRIGAFILLGLLGASIIATRQSRIVWYATARVGTAIMVVAGIWVALLFSPAIVVSDGLGLVCSVGDAKVPTICVHPADSRFSSTMQHTAQRVSEVIGETHTLILSEETNNGYDDKVVSHEGGNNLFVSVPGLTSVNNEKNVQETTREAIIYALMPTEHCPLLDGRTHDFDEFFPDKAILSLHDVIRQRSGGTMVGMGMEMHTKRVTPFPYLENFDSLNDKQLQHWIHDHHDSIVQCTLQESDLPAVSEEQESE